MGRRFSAHNTRSFPTASQFESLFHGELACVCVRRFAGRAGIERILRNFLRLSAERLRTDGVPGTVLGAYHFGRKLEDYFKEAERNSSLLDRLMLGVDDPIRELFRRLKERLGEAGIDFRPAAWRSHVSPPYVLRSWTGRGRYLLEPHDDINQLSDPKQCGFEIQNVKIPIGINVCLRNSGGGGELVVWDVQPSTTIQAECKQGAPGYGYDDATFQRAEKFSVQVREGDAYFLNGRYVHAVTAKPSGGDRVTLSCLAGLLTPALAVQWT